MEWWTYLAIAAGTAAAVMTFGDSRSRQRRTAAQLAAVEHKLQLIIDHLGIVGVQPHLPEVMAHLEQGKKLHAIKAYRDATGSGLAEAKESVERIARDRGLDIR